MPYENSPLFDPFPRFAGSRSDVASTQPEKFTKKEPKRILFSFSEWKTPIIDQPVLPCLEKMNPGEI